jgi:hypothetical protein
MRVSMATSGNTTKEMPTNAGRSNQFGVPISSDPPRRLTASF